MPDPDKSERPKKPRKSKKRPKSSPSVPPKNDPVLPLPEGAPSIPNLSAYFAGFEDPRKKRLAKNTKLMCRQMEEYLSTFIVIGYSVDGEPISMTCAKSQKDMDSLSTALQRYIVGCMDRHFPGGDLP